MLKLNREFFDKKFSVNKVWSVGMICDEIGSEWSEEFVENGIYCLEYGSRGEVESVNYCGKVCKVVSDLEELCECYELDSIEDSFIEYEDGKYVVGVDCENSLEYLWVEG